MRVFTEKSLQEFARQHPEAKEALAVWFKMMRRRSYANTHEVKRDFPKVDFPSGELAVFNIGNTQYHLVT